MTTDATTTTPAAGSPVYCSGPMFSVGDLWEQQNVATALEGANFTTYLPQRDGIEVGKIMALLNHPLLGGKLGEDIMNFVRKCVFALDFFQLIERCQSLVFNLDGRTPDDGSVVETASAFTAGKPLVVYKTTPITMLAGEDNPMINGLAPNWTYVNDVTQIPAALTEAIAASADAGYTFAPPPTIAALIKNGSTVWDVLQTLRGQPTDTPDETLAWLHAFQAAMDEQPAVVSAPA